MIEDHEDIRREFASVLRDTLPQVRLALKGRQKWTPQQTQLFKLLADKCLPDISASFQRKLTQYEDVSRLSRQELEALASGLFLTEEAVSPVSCGSQPTAGTAPEALADMRETIVRDERENAHDVCAAQAPAHDAREPGGGGATPPLESRADLSPPYPDENSQQISKAKLKKPNIKGPIRGRDNGHWRKAAARSYVARTGKEYVEPPLGHPDDYPDEPGSVPTGARIKVLTPNENILYFLSARDAAAHLNTYTNNVSRACNGHMPSVKGHKMVWIA